MRTRKTPTVHPVRPPLRPLALACGLLLTGTACDREPASAPPAATPQPAPPPPPPPPTSPAPTAPPPAEKAPPAMLKVGDPAPAFRVLDHTGKERSLGDFQGKRVILWFFPKALTGG